MNDKKISRYPVPDINELPDDLRDRILGVQEKAGFVPNVFLTLAHRPEECRAFFDYHDALMFDYRGQVAEATGANIFFVQNGELHTPKPDCFLDGITRRTVIDLAKKRQIKVVERAIMPDEMATFEQAFLTGSAAEVTPLSEIGPYNFEVGEMTKTLMYDYDALVKGKA